MQTDLRNHLIELLKFTQDLEGQAFLEAAVSALSVFLGAKFVFVGQVVANDDAKGEQVCSLALSRNGEIVDNICYELPNTPCAELVGQKACVIPAKVVERYPQDSLLAEFGIEGYAGIPLRSHEDGAMGIAVALFDKPIEDPELVSAVLNLYSGRFANYLEMQSAKFRASDNQRRLTALMQNTPLGVVFWDAQWRIVAWRGAAEEIFGYSEEEARNLSFSDLVPATDRPLVSETIRDLTLGATSSVKSNANLRKDGRTIYCEWYNTAYRDEEGNLLGFSSLAHDVSQARAYQQRLEERNRELATLSDELSKEAVRSERANEAKTQFLSTMSHELRTPLNAVIGFAEILQRELYGPLGNPRYKEDIEVIVSSGKSLLELVNDILDVSLIVSDRVEVDIEELDPQELVRETVTSFRPFVSTSDQSLRLSLPESSAAVRADRRRLKQCLRNLIDNALKYAGPGARIEVSCETDDRQLFVRVADDGPGIPVRHLEDIMTPFYRGQDARTAEQGGAGLGLFIVNHLVATFGGRFTLENRSGGGVLATLSLPFNPECPDVERIVSDGGAHVVRAKLRG